MTTFKKVVAIAVVTLALAACSTAQDSQYKSGSSSFSRSQNK